MRVLEAWQACGHGYTRQHHGVLVFALRLRCIHGLLLERSGDQAKPTDNAKPTPTRPQCVKRHGFFWSLLVGHTRPDKDRVHETATSLADWEGHC